VIITHLIKVNSSHLFARMISEKFGPANDLAQ
jgi:hypothetical protein